METIRFLACKIAPRISLGKLAFIFHFAAPPHWKEYIVLGDQELENIFKHKITGKRVYLFVFGCMTCVNLELMEIDLIFRYLHSLIPGMGGHFLANHFEEFTVTTDDRGWCVISDAYSLRYEERVEEVLAIVLAKSTQLDSIETKADEILTWSERFLDNLRRGRMGFKTKRSMEYTGRVLRFEHDNFEGVRVFERPGEAGLYAKALYDELARYFELQVRYTRVQQKLDVLRSIVHRYFNLKHRQISRGLLRLEIVFLALFPLVAILSPYIIKFFAGK